MLAERNRMTQTPLDYDTVKDTKSTMRGTWLHSLIDPFCAPICRMPSDIAYNSHLLQDRETFQLTIGSASDFVGYFAPTNSIYGAQPDWCFISRIPGSSYNYFSQTASFASFMNHTPSYYAMQLSAPNSVSYSSFFKQGRLVSAGLIIRYIGRADQHSGFISAGATVLGENPLSTYPVSNNDINELLYVQRVAPADGLRIVWTPVDEQSKFFKTLTSSGNSSPQMIFYFHGVGLPQGTILDVEVVRNYEFLPHPDYAELFKGSSDPAATLSSPSSYTNIQGVAEKINTFDKTTSMVKNLLPDIAISTLKSFSESGLKPVWDMLGKIPLI